MERSTNGWTGRDFNLYPLKDMCGVIMEKIRFKQLAINYMCSDIEICAFFLSILVPCAGTTGFDFVPQSYDVT